MYGRSQMPERSTLLVAAWTRRESRLISRSRTQLIGSSTPCISAITYDGWHPPEARAQALLLLLGALHVAGNAAGDRADRRARPAAAAGDRGDSCAGECAHGRAADGSLLLRGHGRASDQGCGGHDGRRRCET